MLKGGREPRATKCRFQKYNPSKCHTSEGKELIFQIKRMITHVFEREKKEGKEEEVVETKLETCSRIPREF